MMDIFLSRHILIRFSLKTFESHIAGRPHQKKMAQVGRAKKLEEKVKMNTLDWKC